MLHKLGSCCERGMELISDVRYAKRFFDSETVPLQCHSLCETTYVHTNIFFLYAIVYIYIDYALLEQLRTCQDGRAV